MNDYSEWSTTALLTLRRLEQPSENSSSSSSKDGNRDAYEFVAFLLWYLVLVLCCVIPTCCAYRRRRVTEARMLQQEAAFDRLQQQNLVIWSTLAQRGMEPWDVHAQTQRLQTALEATTVTVREEDIVVRDDSTPAVEECSNLQGDVCSFDDNTVLCLNKDDPLRVVAGSCAICLCEYSVGDQVTYAAASDCLHAFHSDCIVPWLAKKQEPKCPCCRQDFCTLPDPPSPPQQSRATIWTRTHSGGLSVMLVPMNQTVTADVSATTTTVPEHEPNGETVTAGSSSDPRTTAAPTAVDEEAPPVLNDPQEQPSQHSSSDSSSEQVQPQVQTTSDCETAETTPITTEDDESHPTSSLELPAGNNDNDNENTTPTA